MFVFRVILFRIFPHSDQNNSKHGHFLCSTLRFIIFVILLVKYHPAFKIKTIVESEQLTTEQTFPFSMFTYLILINRLTLITLITVSIANFVSKAKEVEVPLWVRYFHLCFPQFFKLGASTKTYAIESVNTWMFILKYFGSKLSYRYNNSGVDWSNIILYRNFNI